MPRININIQNYTKKNLDQLVGEFGYASWDDAIDIAVQGQLQIEQSVIDVSIDSQEGVPIEADRGLNRDHQSDDVVFDSDEDLTDALTLSSLSTINSVPDIRGSRPGRLLRPLKVSRKVVAQQELLLPAIDTFGRTHPKNWISTQWNSPLALVVAIRGVANALENPAEASRLHDGMEFFKDFPGYSLNIANDVYLYCELVRQWILPWEADIRRPFLNGLPVVDPNGPAMRRVIRSYKNKSEKVLERKLNEEFFSRKDKATARFTNAFIGAVGKARKGNQPSEYPSSLLIPFQGDYFRVTSYAVKMRLLGHTGMNISLTDAGWRLAEAGSLFLDSPAPDQKKLGAEADVFLQQIKSNVPEEVDQFRALLTSIKTHQDEFGQEVTPAQIRRGLLNVFLSDSGLPVQGLLEPNGSSDLEDLSTETDSPLRELFSGGKSEDRDVNAFALARDKRTGALTRMVDLGLIDRKITYPGADGNSTGMVSVIKITGSGETFLKEVTV